ncbi:flagellar basal body P-ring formation chaperone FlgA [Paracoccus sp. (in: a-proteobacteria)]|uniref:flagellar basal body P-ring formation chaperone FlgA n=1 Tax=Paracoccus sp. TaxID=267 RepID=UPI00272B7928|nr:flagellar basal body P-ring formation chaperone FlgA [Paracoccus sp. (in: a-proteobacteria)]
MRRLALMIALALPMAAEARGLSGAETAALIADAMRQAGAPLPDMAPPLRALPDCDATPAVTALSPDWGRVALDCPGPQGWRRVFRTRSGAATPAPREHAEARPVATLPALALVRPLPRGARIAAEDLAQAARPAAGDGGQALADPADAVGRRVRQNLRAGQIVLERHLEPALDVEPGDAVTIALNASGIEIIVTGTALGGGVAGDRIPVRPGPAGREVEALITARGVVRVRPNMRRRAAVRQGIRRQSWSTQ